jgi:hypothetical protein
MFHVCPQSAKIKAHYYVTGLIANVARCRSCTSYVQYIQNIRHFDNSLCSGQQRHLLSFVFALQQTERYNCIPTLVFGVLE